jgi:hypothetical protein
MINWEKWGKQTSSDIQPILNNYRPLSSEWHLTWQECSFGGTLQNLSLYY